MDRRIEALKRNQNSDTERDGTNLEKSSAAVIPFDDDDKESFLDELHSSPDSSPECHVSSRTRLAPSNVKTVGIPSSKRGQEEQGGGDLEGRAKERAEAPGRKGEDEAEFKGEETNSDAGDGIGSDRESTTATPPSSRSPSLGASTTTISSSDNAPDPNFSQ